MMEDTLIVSHVNGVKSCFIDNIFSCCKNLSTCTELFSPANNYHAR